MNSLIQLIVIDYTTEERGRGETTGVLFIKGEGEKLHRLQSKWLT